MEGELISCPKIKLGPLTQSYALAKTNNDTARNEAPELSSWRESLDKSRDDR